MTDLGPGVALVAGGGDGFGECVVGLRDEAGEGVQDDRAVAKPVGGSQLREGVDGIGEDGGAVESVRGAGISPGWVGRSGWLVMTRFPRVV